MSKGTFPSDSDPVGLIPQIEPTPRKAHRASTPVRMAATASAPFVLRPDSPREGCDPDHSYEHRVSHRYHEGKSGVVPNWPERPGYTDENDTRRAFIPKALSNACALCTIVIVICWICWCFQGKPGLASVGFRAAPPPEDPRARRTSFSNGTLNSHSTSGEVR